MDHVASPHPTQAAASFLDRILAERKRLERALAAVGDLIVIYEAIAAGKPASVAPPIQEVSAAAQAPKEKPTISPERAEAPVDPLQKFYPERNEIIKREWPKGTPTPEILAMLHALPGAQINARLLYIKAGKLGVHRAPSAPKATPAPDTAVDLSPLLSIATATERKRPEFDPGPSVAVDFEQVRRWASERGVRFDIWDDLPKVNERRESLCQAPFKRLFPIRGVTGKYR